MIKIQNLTSFLSEKLNAIVKERGQKYEFTIVPEVGHYTKSADLIQIEGVLKRIGLNTPPIIGFINSDSKYLLDLLIPTPGGADKYVVDIYDIFDTLTTDINGNVYELDGGEVKFVIEGANILGEIQKTAAVGQSVIMRIGLSIQYSENMTMVNHYDIEIKVPGVIDDYTKIYLTNINQLINFYSTSLNNVANLDDGLDYNQNFARTFTLTFYAQNNESINAFVDNYLMSNSHTIETNNLMLLRITRHNSSVEFKVKIASIQTNIPNNLGYETITVTLSKYSFDDVEEENADETTD